MQSPFPAFPAECLAIVMERAGHSLDWGCSLCTHACVYGVPCGCSSPACIDGRPRPRALPAPVAA